MKILDRYILKKFLISFFFILGAIILIIILLDITEKNDVFIKHKLSFKEIFAYYCAFLPFMANMVMPITVFITTVFVTARLAQATEIIALLSGAISFRRFLVPYFIGASMITVCSFLLTGWVLADANKKRVAFELAYIDSPLLRMTTKNIHIKLTPTQYLYVGQYRSSRNSGIDITLENIIDNELKDKLSAKSMQWIEEENKWRIQDWMHRSFDGLEEHITQGHMLDIDIALKPDDFTINPRLYETLTLTELASHIQKLKKRGVANVHFFLVEKYVRYMSPFAAIILTFMGVIVSARKVRGGTGIQIALGFILALIYIAFFLFARGVAEVKGTNLLLKVWTPNIVFSLISFLIYKFIPK